MRLKKDVQYQHITLLDDKYPNYLKNVECPPFVLFYEGNLNLIKDRTSAIKYDVLESGGRLFLQLILFKRVTKLSLIILLLVSIRKI